MKIVESLIPVDIRPPAAIEVEASILGGVLINSDSILNISFLQPAMFYPKSHQVIYEAMLSLFEDGIQIDSVTTYERLKKRETLEQAGGIVYLSKLSQSISSAANIETHAKVVYEKYLLRSLISASQRIAVKSYEQTEDAFEIIEEAEKTIFDLTQYNFKKYTHIKDATKSFLARLDSNEGNDVETGFYDLDAMLKISNGQLIVIAGRPSMGKSAVGLDIIKHNAVNHYCGLFTLEMNEPSICGRYISKESGLTYFQVANKYKPSEIMSAAHKVLNYKVLIDDSSSISITELRSKARRMKLEYGIKLLVVDYLQLMTAKSDSREREIAMISRGLKATAKDLDIPVIAIAQLNRSAEARTDKRPNLSDLRESGAIEQDADSVVFVYRPEYYGIKTAPDGLDMEGKAFLIIAKQRNGATGEVSLGFTKETATFYNLTSVYPAQADII